MKYLMDYFKNNNPENTESYLSSTRNPALISLFSKIIRIEKQSCADTLNMEKTRSTLFSFTFDSL